MKTPVLFIKAIISIISMILALAGIVQLRSGLWTAGATCIALAIAGLVFSVRLLEKVLLHQKNLKT